MSGNGNDRDLYERLEAACRERGYLVESDFPPDFLDEFEDPAFEKAMKLAVERAVDTVWRRMRELAIQAINESDERYS
jgi:hypothetical protein